MHKEEDLLIRKAQRGNLQAFENLVYRYEHSAAIYRLLRIWSIGMMQKSCN